MKFEWPPWRSQHHESQLQCPFSKCFPQLYEDSDAPCSKSSFRKFSPLNEHIWLYHSYRFSCEHCDFRFTDVKKGDKIGLEQKKRKHFEKYHRDDINGITHASDKKGKQKRQAKGNLSKSKRDVETMTLEKDEAFELWKPPRHQEGHLLTEKEKYNLLCRHLFGDGVALPEDPYYNYLLPEHIVNSSSKERGERNIAYVEGRPRFSFERNELASQSVPAPSPHNVPSAYIPQATHDLLSLIGPAETGTGAQNWTLPDGKVTEDSGYASNQGLPEADLATIQSPYQPFIEDDFTQQATFFNNHSVRAQHGTGDHGVSGWSRQDLFFGIHDGGPLLNGTGVYGSTNDTPQHGNQYQSPPLYDWSELNYDDGVG